MTQPESARPTVRPWPRLGLALGKSAGRALALYQWVRVSPSRSHWLSKSESESDCSSQSSGVAGGITCQQLPAAQAGWRAFRRTGSLRRGQVPCNTAALWITMYAVSIPIILCRTSYLPPVICNLYCITSQMSQYNWLCGLFAKTKCYVWSQHRVQPCYIGIKKVLFRQTFVT